MRVPYTWQVLSTCMALLLLSSSAYAQVQVPPSELVWEATQSIPISASEFLNKVESGEASSERCEFTPTEVRCHCVGMDTVEARDIVWTEQGVSAKGVRIRHQQLTLVAESLEVGTHLEIWLGALQLDDESDGIIFRHAEGTRSQLRFEGVALGAVGGLDADLCAKSTSINVSRGWFAETATAESDTWVFSNVDSGPVSFPTIHGDRAQSGVITPNLYASSDVYEAEFGYYVEVLDALPYLTIAPLNWYGAGLAKVTENEGRTHVIRTDVRWDHDEGVVFNVGGELDVGTSGRSRLSARVEHPSSTAAREGRAIERGSEFRDWRITEIGAGLSGANHFLALRGGALSVSSSSEETAWMGGIRYGQTKDVASHLQLGVDIEQQTRFEGEDRSHEAGLGVRLAFPFGDAGRARITPDITTAMNFGVLPEDLGFEASTSGALLLGLQADMSFSGRFPGVTHRIRPLVRIDREVFGFTQRPILPPDSQGFAFQRVPDWTSIWAEFQQDLVFDSFTLSAPLGVWFSSDGFENIIDTPRFQGALGVDGKSWGASGGMGWQDRCTDEPCTPWGWHGAAWLRIADWWVYASSADQSATWAANESSLARTSGGLSGWQTSQDIQGNTGSPGHRLGTKGQLMDLQTGLEGVWDEGSTRGQGVVARLGYPVVGMGWGLGTAASLTRSGDWNVMLNWSVQ